MLTPNQSREWQDAAMYYVTYGRLPMLLSDAVTTEITRCPDEWAVEVRAAGYARARRLSHYRATEQIAIDRGDTGL